MTPQDLPDDDGFTDLASRLAAAAITHRELFVKLSKADIEAIVDAYSDHLHIDLPPAGDGKCCPGAAIMGPQACTCWTPVHDLQQEAPKDGVPLPPSPVQMCGDCAYRPGSPERSADKDYQGGQDLLDRLVTDGTPFYCHAGMRSKARHVHPSGTEVAGHPGAYDPPIINGIPYKASGQPGDLCAGWTLRRIKEAQK